MKNKKLENLLEQVKDLANEAWQESKDENFALESLIWSLSELAVAVTYAYKELP